MVAYVIKILFFPFVIATLFLYSADSESLHRSDIQTIMQQIFSEHVEKKAISGEILSRSLKTYIEQFDPDGIYLLQSEVAPYSNMKPDEIATLEKEYRANDFSSYEKVNDLIQKAISRSRSYRSQLEQNPKALYQLALSSPEIEDVKEYVYPATEQQLREKIKKSIINFVQLEVRKFGKKGVEGHEKQAVDLFEKQIRMYEDQYTYRLENGELMSPEAEENLFSLHVLKAITKTLDAHTAILNPNEAYEMRMRLEKEFDGIGIAFQQSPQGITVIQVIEGSPAALDGKVKKGDELIEIDGKKAEDLTFDTVMEMLRGTKGQPVNLVFNRDGTKISTTLKRAPIVIKENRVEVAHEKFGDGILGVITLHSFYQNDQGVSSVKDVRNAIDELQKEGHLKGLVLDLRDNSGGFLSQAVKVASLFITNGVIVISKYADGSKKIYRDTSNDIAYGCAWNACPLIVLTSRATASAAEIVAQALQDYGVALIVGDDQTYGKGTIQTQTVTDNKGGSSYFKVTVGKYYTVSGKTPQLHGVKSDVVVPGPYSNIHLGEEFLTDTLASDDTISPAYQDKLEDIDPGLKPWYLHFYVPTIQPKENYYQKILPELKKNSSYRLSHNKNYKLFLKKFNPDQSLTFNQELTEEAEEKKPGNFGTTDLQLAEAMNILKDIIYLQAQEHHKSNMVGSEKVPP